MDFEVVGSIKIKDGLFLGDEYAAQDLEFVVTNKVSRIINCAGKQIPCHWNTIGVSYLTYGWMENDSEVIFDARDEVLNTTYRFIDEALTLGEAVLIHSVKGHNRSVCIIAAYMMRKYRWTLYKTLEFLHARRPDLEIRASFFNQLLSLENKLRTLGMGAKTYNWQGVAESDNNELENEEVLLTNTFLNSKNQEFAEYNTVIDKQVQTKLQWVDNQQEKQQLNQTIIPSYENCKFRQYRYNQEEKIKYKSALKGSHQEFEYTPVNERPLEKNENRNGAFQMRPHPKLKGQVSKNGSQREFNTSSKHTPTNNNNFFNNNGINSNSELQENNNNEDISPHVPEFHNKYQPSRITTTYNNIMNEDQKLQPRNSKGDQNNDLGTNSVLKKKAPMNNYMGNNNNNGINFNSSNSRFYQQSNQNSQNNVDQIFEDHNQGNQFKSPSYSYENNFKNTQRIYSAPLGIIGRQTQMNNFLGGIQKQSNKNSFEMPSLMNNKKSNVVHGNFFPEQEKKTSKRTQKLISRPSTAPSKQKDNPIQKGPINGFGVRTIHKQNNGMQQNPELMVSGSQRAKNTFQQGNNNAGEDFQSKKMRCSSPGNFYSQNSFAKSNKWKV